MRRPPSSKDKISRELNVIPIVNIFIILIPVLLVSAEFTRAAIVQFSADQHHGARTETADRNPPSLPKPDLQLTAVITDSSATLFINEKVLPTVHSDAELRAALRQIRGQFPDDSFDAALLASESDVVYDRIIQVMDMMREVKLTNISVTRLRG